MKASHEERRREIVAMGLSGEMFDENARIDREASRWLPWTPRGPWRKDLARAAALYSRCRALSTGFQIKVSPATRGASTTAGGAVLGDLPFCAWTCWIKGAEYGNGVDALYGPGQVFPTAPKLLVAILGHAHKTIGEIRRRS